MTDWPKVIQVFGSGIIGVYLIMFLLMILVQLADKLVELKIVDAICRQTVWQTLKKTNCSLGVG